MGKRKILCVQGMPEPGLALLRTRADVEWEVISPDETDTLPDRLADVEGVTLRTVLFDRAMIDMAPRLKAVARFGVGFDAVDVVALTARGIPLMVAGEANSPSVAEHALFMMIALAKLALPFHRAVATRDFSRRYALQGNDLGGKTVLIIGYGRIGSRTSALCRAFGMRVEVYDPYVSGKALESTGTHPVPDLGDALERADFVSVHCPKNDETTGLIDAAAIARMKSTAVIVNTARGGIVEENALAGALRAGGLGGAGLDVFGTEPPPDNNPLLGLDNVILSPHVAGLTREAADRMAVVTCQNILDVFDGCPDSANVVNPEVLKETANA